MIHSPKSRVINFDDMMDLAIRKDPNRLHSLYPHLPRSSMWLPQPRCCAAMPFRGPLP